MVSLNEAGLGRRLGDGEKAATAFVVLRHDDREGTHYDLMIDEGEHLATWKCPQPPETAQISPLSCRWIGDHRRGYLDYEGYVSGDRGEVRRHDRGRCTMSARSSDRWHVLFQGRKLIGSYELSRIADDSWRLIFTDP